MDDEIERMKMDPITMKTKLNGVGMVFVFALLLAGAKPAPLVHGSSRINGTFGAWITMVDIKEEHTLSGLHFEICKAGTISRKGSPCPKLRGITCRLYQPAADSPVQFQCQSSRTDAPAFQWRIWRTR